MYESLIIGSKLFSPISSFFSLAPYPPIVIAGPCAVESDNQMQAVARHLSAKGVRFLRGGAYIPRSSPYSYQGMGTEGLKILKHAAETHKMYTVSELLDALCVRIVVGAP